MNNVERVKHMYDLYASGDIDGAMADWTDDFRFAWKADPTNSRYAGSSAGAAEFKEEVAAVLADVEFLSFRRLLVFGEGDHFAAKVRIDFRRRRDGVRGQSEIAHLWTFRNREPVDLEKYFDSASRNLLHRDLEAAR